MSVVSPASPQLPILQPARLRMLRAMGLTPYRLRGADEAGASAAAASLAIVAPSPVLRQTRHRAILQAALQAVGIDSGTVREMSPGAHHFRVPDEIRVFLVFGDDQARALRAALPEQLQPEATIAVVPALSETGLATFKRELWRACRRLARAMAVEAA